MSNDKTKSDDAIATPSETPAAAGEQQQRVTRRSLLKYASGGLALAALPALPGCAAEPEIPGAPPLPTLTKVDEAALYANATWVDAIMRKDDLVVLKLGLVNLDVRNVRDVRPDTPITLSGSLYLGRTQVGVPSYIIVVFQPQHIFEQSFAEPPGSPLPPGTNGYTKPIKSRIAQESRIAFIVPNNVNSIPYELDKLLAAMSGYQLNVAPGALPQSQATSSSELVPVFSGLLKAVADSTTTDASTALVSLRQRTALLSYAAANPEVTLTTTTSLSLSRDAVATETYTRDTDGLIIPIGPAIPQKPTKPTDLQTAIELPFRLQISPNSYAHFEHSPVPVKSAVTQRVELWHSRLATSEPWQKTIRAMWTRDTTFDATDATKQVGSTDDPYPLQSTKAQDRADIVHLTTNYTLLDDALPSKQRTKAVDVSMLALSALGGWIDSHGTWNDPNPQPPDNGAPNLVAWDHHAPMGRDQKVRIVRVGYLYPFGHKAVWVTVTERKFFRTVINGVTKDYTDTAYLWTREFIIVKEPLKSYESQTDPRKRGFPFKSVRFKTIVTPNLKQRSGIGPLLNSSSWAEVATGAFPFEIQAFDHDGNAHDFTAGCVWIATNDASLMMNNSATAKGVGDAYALTNYNDGERRLINMRGQRVAYADCADIDDTRYTTKEMRLKADTFFALRGVPWTPQLDEAALDIDTVRGLTGKNGATKFSYFDTYLANGFGDPGAPNSGHVFLALSKTEPNPRKMDFNKESHKSGGFVAPSMGVTALSRKQGIVSGDPADAGDMNFNPEKFFDKALVDAKLFGCVPLSGIIKAFVGDKFLKQAPQFITQSLQTAEALITAIQSAADLISDPLDGVTAQLAIIQTALAAYPANPYANPLPAPVAALAQPARDMYPRLYDRAMGAGLDTTAVNTLVTNLTNALNALVTAAPQVTAAIQQIASLTASSPQQPVIDAIVNAITTATGAAATIGTELGKNILPIQDGARAALQKLTSKLAKMAPDAATLGNLVKAFVAGEEAIKDLHIKVEWAPEISGFPAGAEIFWPNDKHGFKLGIDIRAKDSGGLPAGADIYASLSDFELHLLGSEPFMKLEFDKLIFKAGTAGKPEIDCVFRGMHFDGPLKFVEVLRNFIPLDGFSDPPNVKVDETGLKANFSLPLPGIAIGVLTLENLSFSAGFEIPFIGKSLAVTFAFCSREEPFVLTVCMLGGGGFVGITITPDGVRILEISFEAQACLAIDFGIASGSISIAVGIYLKIEGKDVTLTGYVRFRGEVDVLGGLISASIELEMDLTYESAHDKVIGHAKLEIDVAVAFIHINVSVEVTKKFRGNNGDPTFRQLMQPIGNEIPWDQYCDAFCPVAAA